ncbi:PD-(D/E)XK nuclease family transposase [Thiocapsa sp.]|uniref:PD-(D/E)XK nuclease family transposase n=1 Tax=Thiocapsa sp. TaxID=2024551 RepID=UPI00359454EC
MLNPYNERETLDDKLTIVDVKARDTARRVFQVEIQFLVFPRYLTPRILYAWADLYSQNCTAGRTTTRSGRPMRSGSSIRPSLPSDPSMLTATVCATTRGAGSSTTAPSGSSS